MNDLATFPASVTVAFPVTGIGAPDAGFFEVQVELTSLSLTQFNNIVGAPWSKILHRYEQAAYSTSVDPTNEAALEELAAQVARDWYLWQLAYLDRYFVGIVDWTPEGNHDIEWCQESARIVTHVQREVFNPSEDLLIVASTLDATTVLSYKCIPDCDGNQFCAPFPTKIIKDGPCDQSSGSGPPPDEFVTITCDGVDYEIAKTLCMRTSNLNSPGDPVGPPGAPECEDFYAQGLSITYQGYNSIDNSWSWAASATSVGCGITFGLTIQCTTDHGGFPLLVIKGGGNIGTTVGDNFGPPTPMTAVASVGYPVTPWTVRGFATYDLASYLGSIWIATADTTGSEVPGTSAVWREVDVIDLLTLGPDMFIQFISINDGLFGAGKYVVTSGTCASPPIVYSSHADICEDTTTLTIHGANFLPGATVAFSPAGTGSASYVSSNELSITALTGQGVGALYAVVTTTVGNSGTAVQVATVEPVPVITPDSSDLAQDATTLTINGTGFVPGSTALTLSSGTFTYSATTTAITVTFSAPPDLGSLTATVETACGDDADVEVATVIAGSLTLVGHWLLNEGSGSTCFDTSGNGNDMTITGVSPWSADTPGPQAGSGGCVLGIAGTTTITKASWVGLPTGAVDISVSFWLKVAAASGVAFTYGDSDVSTFVRENDALTWTDGGGSVLNGASGAASTGTWILYTMTWSAGTDWVYYEDGVAVNSGMAGFTVSTGSGGAISILLGVITGGTGKMKDLRVYSGVLSAGQVADIFSGSPP